VARINYDERTAAAFKASREIPRDGLLEWRDAVRRHLRALPETMLVDVGAGTGQFSTAFSDWFGIRVLAVEPSAAMREQIPRTSAIEAFEGDATALPLPDDCADGAWLSLVLHHIPDLEAAARAIRRVLRPDAPVLIRQGFPNRCDGIENVRWFPETAKVVSDYPSVEKACEAFATAGFRREALERVRETRAGTLFDLLGELDTLRAADTTLRQLTEDEFRRGEERIRRAAQSPHPEPRSNTLDLLVLR
jgi:SAM-dependent methyltransferase